MLRNSSARFGGEGSLLDKMVPGYQEKIWARVPVEWKKRKIEYDLAQFTKSLESHKNFQNVFLKYKEIEAKFAPSEKFRKPAVDWRRQMTRGTLFYGRSIEGPNGCDYRPGRTFDRLQQLVPFTAEEWSARRNHRFWDGAKLAGILYAVFLGNRMLTETPVVWC
jgi:ubiquinol-cytochrome c reductase cytochrome c1 subunit